jgi:hypothetical protein
MSYPEWIPVSTPPTTSGVKMIASESGVPERPFIWPAWYECEGTRNMPGWQLFLPTFRPQFWMEMPAPPESFGRVQA